MVAFSPETAFELMVGAVWSADLVTRLCSRVVAEIDPSSLAPSTGFSVRICVCTAVGFESTVCRWTCPFIHVMMLELQSSLNARANRTVESDCVEEQPEDEWQKIASSRLLAVLRALRVQTCCTQRSVQQRLKVISEEELPKGAWPCGACFVVAFFS